MVQACVVDAATYPIAHCNAFLASMHGRDKHNCLRHDFWCGTAALRGNKEETADDEDATPADRTDSLVQLQQKVPNLMAQMNGISQNPTTSQI